MTGWWRGIPLRAIVQFGFQGVTPEGPQSGPPGYETALLYLGVIITMISAGHR